MTTNKLLTRISFNHNTLTKLGNWIFWSAIFVATLAAGPKAHADISCNDNSITANVVVLDNPTVFNRLGAQNPNWITYALKRDVVYVDWGNPRRPNPDCVDTPSSGDKGCFAADSSVIDAFIGDSNHLKPITELDPPMTPMQLRGKVELRPDKRPRPLVIRSVEGSCLTVHFENLLAPGANPNNARQGLLTPGNAEPNVNTLNLACFDDPVEGDGICLDDNPACDVVPQIGDLTCQSGTEVVDAFLVIPDFVDGVLPFQGLENNDQVAGRCAGFHATGTELFNGMEDDGSMVGANHGGGDTGPTNAGQSHCGEGMAAPGEYRRYDLITPHEGAFIINSYGATLGSESNAGNLGIGMFGALNVQPCGLKDPITGQCDDGKGARIYRSQVTEEEMRLATYDFTPKPGEAGSDCTAIDIPGADCNTGGQPIVDYDAFYPLDCGTETDPTGQITDGVWCQEGKAGLPIISMVCTQAVITNGGDCAVGELLHSDINAIIAGPVSDGTFHDGHFPKTTYPLESVDKVIPVYPNRLEPFREFTSQYHDEQTNSQVFPNWYNHPVMRHVLHGVKDQFMINYGSGGIGSEIISSRLRTGPMHDCTDCAYEEFFLASQTVGDPALLVNYPANSGIEACNPENIAAGPTDPNACWRNANLSNGPIADNYALFQEDPSNVHNAYSGDFVKMRNTHAGAFEQHIFHFHNHQWLFNPNDDNANYLDAQEIMPGSGHTYELVNGGAGNRNHTVGDAIFHCHFYPHFAQGMWYHMRNHDVFETGTVLEVSGGTADAPNIHTNRWALRSGKPAQGARALPDGELPDGSPIPAVVPLPGRPMPQMPAKVEIVAVDRGSHSLLGGRTDIDGIPDSSQAIVDYVEARGPDGIAGTRDDKSPGYPFWLAGNECGVDLNAVDTSTDRLLQGYECPMGVVGQRMPTPPLDMLTVDGAAALSPTLIPNPDCADVPLPGDEFCLDTAGIQQDAFVANPDPAADWTNLGGGWDGGLPRHALLGYTSGGSSADTQNRLDFRKIVHMAQPVFFPETGTDLEKVSMAYQAERHRPSVAYGTSLNELDLPTNAFVLNGAPPVPGGPFNDPCVDDTGTPLTGGESGLWYSSDMPLALTEDRWDKLLPLGSSPYDNANPRTYKLANLQIDAVFNKLGHHYTQERIIILWGDITATVLKDRPPEPLVMRFNTFDCGKILHANLVPSEFEVDDFQVRTPTDIIGQHIHLPKWDLTTNDGAANGWNYEDGTLSPMMVQERIHAINEYNHLVEECHANAANCVIAAGTLPGQLGPIDLTGLEPVATLTVAEGADPFAISAKGSTHLTAENHYHGDIADDTNPQFTSGGDHGMYLGARTTIQRLLIDPVLNTEHVDRGLGLTFSHDHYGPSTFQQIGLYSTILAEPAGSTWVHNESGVPLNTRHDGGPTTWQAAILTGSDVDPETGAPRYVDGVGGAGVPAHREFYFEMSDFQHAYNMGTNVGANALGINGNCAAGDCLGHDGETPIIQPNPFNATVAFAPSIQETWKEAVNPTLKTEAQTFPDVVTAKGGCPGPAGNFDPTVPRPCAEAINIGHSSTWVINFRNEPIGYRVFDPNAKGPNGAANGQNGTQAKGRAGDLALAFSSSINRAIPQMNTRFGDSPPGYRNGADDYCQGNGQGDLINCDRGAGDPFTPIMRVYEGDQTKVKIQVGATEEQHQTTVHGIKWLSNGSGFGRSPNSGWRNFQSHGISEQFSLQAPLNPALRQAGQTVDYLYATDATRPGMWLGTWGILRTYGRPRSDLVTLPNNDIGKNVRFVNQNDFRGVCPRTAPVKNFDIAAVLANDVLPNNLGVDIEPNTQVFLAGDDGIQGTPDDVLLGGDSDGDGFADNVGGPLNTAGGTLVYNRRATVVPGIDAVQTGGAGPLNDPTAMMYVLNDDLIPVVEYEAKILGMYPSCLKKKGKGGAVNFDPTLPNCAQDAQLEDRGCMLNGSYKSDLATCAAMLSPDAPVEPLILRANAGDCIEVQLRNRLVTRQGVTKDTGQKVFYGDGRPAMHDDGKGDTYYAGSPTGTQVYLDNIEFFAPPDLAGWQDMMWGVTRHIQPAPDGNPVNDEMHFFNNNLVRPGAYAGIHAQLVEYDASRDDGLWVGQNQQQVASPGGVKQSSFYAGHLEYVLESETANRRNFRIEKKAVEFGGSNLLSADRVKQPQKGLFGALVIEPEATVSVDASTLVPDGQGACAVRDEDETSPTFGDCLEFVTRPTRAQVTVDAGAKGSAGENGTYRETIAIAHKIANLRWADGSAIKNVAQEELGVEGAEDSGHAGFNYGMEPAWFRFGLPPNVPFGNAGTANSYGSIPNVQALYANNLVGGDPVTPVFYTTADMATRMHVLNGASADRDSTYILHGHVWQRDPYVCPGESRETLVGLCELDSVGSLALGKNPLGKYMGSEEGMGHVYGHWPILFNAGGSNGVAGDYLFRDYAPNGNRNGMFGILRVEPAQ